MQGTLDLGVDDAVHIAPHPAADPHIAAGRAVDPGQVDGRLHGKAGALHNGVTDEQNLGQHRQHQQNGDDGAAAQAVADGGNDRVGGHAADQHTGYRQNGARRKDGGECFVEGRHNGLARRHLLFQVAVVAGNDDGVVDVGAHLDGVDDEVAQEIQRLILQCGHREVDPDAALNDDDEQDGQTHRLEGEEQNQHNEEGRQNADEDVILPERAGQILDVGGVAHHVIVAAVMLGEDVVDGIQELHRLVAFLGQVEVDHHAAVLVALQLDLGPVELVEEIVQRLLHLAFQLDVAGVHLILQEHEHIKQRHLVIPDPAEHTAVLVMVHGVGHIQCLGHLIVGACQLRELARRHRIGQHIAVLGLGVGQPLAGLDLGAGFQFFQHSALGVIVALGHNDRHHVFIAEGSLDLLVGDLAGALLGGDQIGEAVAVGAVVGQHRRRNHHHGKDGRHDPAGGHIKLAQEVDLGNEFAVAGGIDLFAEEHEQAGHQRKDRQQAEKDGLDEDGSHIPANAEVHESQRPQAGDGGQRGGADLGDGLGQRRDAGFPGILGFVLIGEAVAQNNGIVDGQGQLQNDRDRIGDEGDGAAQKVRSHIEHRRSAEGEQQNRHFGVGARGQRQHHHNNDGRNDQNGAHLTGQVRRHVLAHLGINVIVLAGQGILDAVHRLDAHIVGGCAVKGNGIQRRSPLVVVLGFVKLHTVNAVHPFDLLLQCGGGIRCDVGNHDPCRAEGGEVVIHHRQALAGFGIGRQVGGDVVFHLDPARCHDAENQSQNIQQKEQVAFVHNERRDLLHSAGFRLFIFQSKALLFDRKNSPLQSCLLILLQGTAKTPWTLLNICLTFTHL